MPKDNEVSWLDGFGDEGWKDAELEGFNDLAERKKNEFLKAVIDKAVEYKLINTGTLTKDEGYRVDITRGKAVTTLEIYMIFYGLFQDRGVQGVLKQENAPDSPYKFKNFGMSEEGRENIKNSIAAGRMKVSSSMIAKYEKIGLETRSERDSGDPLEKEAERVAYLIKAFGIKTRPFFKEAYETTFGEKLQYELLETAKKYVIARLKFKNNKK